MKIAILGSGGREHAIAFSISQSKKVKNPKVKPRCAHGFLTDF